MANPNVRQHKDELAVLDALMATETYKDFINELEARRAIALNEIVGPPQDGSFGAFLEREQENGKYQFMGTMLEWFPTRRQALQEIISASEVQITHKNT